MLTINHNNPETFLLVADQLEESGDFEGAEELREKFEQWDDIKTRLLTLEQHDIIRFNKFESWRDDEADGSISFDEMKPIRNPPICNDPFSHDGPIYITSGWFESSDYSNGRAIQASNLRDFAADHFGEDWPDGAHHMAGGFSSEGLAIRLDIITPDMLDSLESLINYPVLCEFTMSEYEIEQQGEAWESWVAHDFERELESALGIEISETGEDFYTLFHELCERANEYWFEDGCDQYIRIENVVAVASLRDLIARNVEFSEE